MTGHGEHVGELRADLESVKSHLCPCGVRFEHCNEHDESREDA